MTAGMMVPPRCSEEDGGHHWVVRVNPVPGVSVWQCSLCPEMDVETSRRDLSIRMYERTAAAGRVRQLIVHLEHAPKTLTTRIFVPSMVKILQAAVDAVLKNN